jgi:hypothetical protein
MKGCNKWLRPFFAGIVPSTGGNRIKERSWNSVDFKKKNQPDEATIAPGMDDGQGLNQEATDKEIQKGDYTEVTTLSYDEVDPS